MAYYFSLTEHQSLYADCVNHDNNQTHAIYTPTIIQEQTW
jgi:hypothetical protein